MGLRLLMPRPSNRCFFRQCRPCSRLISVCRSSRSATGTTSRRLMGQHSNGNQLTRVQIGWKGLEDVINEIRNRINVNQPLEGSGIRIEDSPGGGKLISLSPSPTTSSDNQQPATDPHLLATEVDWHGVKWQDVTVVDPSSCAQSTLSVLTKTGNTDDVVIITVKYPFWVAPSQGEVTG